MSVHDELRRGLQAFRGDREQRQLGGVVLPAAVCEALLDEYDRVRTDRVLEPELGDPNLRSRMPELTEHPLPIRPDTVVPPTFDAELLNGTWPDDCPSLGTLVDLGVSHACNRVPPAGLDPHPDEFEVALLHAASGARGLGRAASREAAFLNAWTALGNSARALAGTEG